MKRAERLKERAEQLIERGERPSAERLSQELGMPEQDVHRCLNYLENSGEVETYTEEMLGQRLRMVGVKRGPKG